MKRCPYCDEEIRDNAIKCKHCGTMLNQNQASQDTLDRHVTIAGTANSLQYDTLDESVTEEKSPNMLGDQYRIIKKLGKGGMGVVYLAEDTEMNDRLVAIKVLPPELADNVRAVENLRREAITAINLNHPNIIRLYGFHSEGNMKYLVMEYIEGQTLEEKLAKNPDGKLTLDETVAIAGKIALALDYAHSRTSPVFHRDLKPSNIIVSNNGEVRLLDFGIAREMKDSYTRVTGKADTSGTLPYMSPEQVRGKQPSAAMDIYSLGVVCYECLSGRPPFYTGELTYQIIHEMPEDLEDVPPHINEAFRNALAKEPAQRPETASVLIGLLKAQTSSKSESKVKEVSVIKKATELPMAIAPFNAEQAKEYQSLTAEFLGIPVEKSVDLGSGIKMEFVLIPAGEFDMGSPDSEEYFIDEKPIHKVTISKPFYIGKFPVTQEQYKVIMGLNPSRFSGINLPVENVSWEDTVEFCEKLSYKQGKEYRLPTEAQWEYACRAGTKTKFSFGNSDVSIDEHSWCDHNSQGHTHPIGQKQPNAFGSYDMIGNVWEWCQDWYDYNLDYYANSPEVDPQGPSEGTNHVKRGGSWFSIGNEYGSAKRTADPPHARRATSGFRVVLEMEQ